MTKVSFLRNNTLDLAIAYNTTKTHTMKSCFSFSSDNVNVCPQNKLQVVLNMTLHIINYNTMKLIVHTYKEEMLYIYPRLLNNFQNGKSKTHIYIIWSSVER